LPEPRGGVPPAEYEARYHERAKVAWLAQLDLRQSQYGSRPARGDPRTGVL